MLLDRVLNRPPFWANDILTPWNEEEFQEKLPFVVRHYWTAQGSINVFNVIGTIHSDYQNRSWFHLLQHGRQIHLNLPLLESNPQYYTETAAKEPPMYFKTMDGRHFFIDDDGNHRTCIARFYFDEKGLTQLHGVVINHYQVDEVFYHLYKQLEHEIQEQNLRVWIKPIRSIQHRDDTAGWKEDHFETLLQWRTDQTTLLLDRHATAQKLMTLRCQKHNWLQKLLIKFR